MPTRSALWWVGAVIALLVLAVSLIALLKGLPVTTELVVGAIAALAVARLCW